MVDIASLLGGVPQELRGERLIRMFDVLPDPQRTAYHLACRGRLSDTSIGVKVGQLLLIGHEHERAGITGALA